MCVPVFYATTHGHTRRIAERIAGVLGSEGHDSVALDVISADASMFDWRSVHAVVLAASLHASSHQPSARDFVRANLDRFNAVPSWFVSVSLSAASANPQERLAARKIAHAFVDSARWSPRRVSSVAGRLAYTQYGLLIRWLMRGIARKEHAPTDTSRDHDFTDWHALDDDARQFGRDVRDEVQRRTRAEHYQSEAAQSL